MRCARPALPWLALVGLSLWTIYSHVSIKKLVQEEGQAAYTRISQDIKSLDVGGTASGDRLTRMTLLEDASEGIQPAKSAVTQRITGATVHHVDFQQLFFHKGFELDSNTTFSSSDYSYSSTRTVWLYSLITTDYDSFQLVGHFLKHYTDLGVQPSSMFCDLLHDPELPDEGLQETRKQFQSAGIHTRTILHPYTPDLQDLAMVTGLAKMPMEPEDWIIVTDMDEYFTYGTSNSVQEAIQAMEEEGASFAVGEMLDHVAPGGALKRVSAATDIWSQFPLICPIVSTIAKGLPAKVTIHKAFLRVGAGHHHIVEPYLAEAYFGSQCKGINCELVMKRYKQRTTQDVFAYTPYKHYPKQYAQSVDASGWQARRWQTWAKVHHFKWHAAVLDNLLSRMVRDSGDCLLDVNEDSCQPTFQFWQEVARQFQKLNATQSIDITDLDCKTGVDTLWNWEQ